MVVIEKDGKPRLTRLWSAEDTPIPKKGQVLCNQFREKFKVVSRVKKDEHNYEIVFDRVG